MFRAIIKAFIISDTKYNDLMKGITNPPSQDEFEKNNVLFLEDNNWCKKCLKKF